VAARAALALQRAEFPATLVGLRAVVQKVEKLEKVEKVERAAAPTAERAAPKPRRCHAR
jgi:hypothetical protein